MTSVDQRNIDPIKEMTRIAHDILSLPSRGFRESSRSTQPGKLIFNSEWCPISLIWGGWDHGTGNTLHIFYGRFQPIGRVLMLLEVVSKYIYPIRLS
jgi:hypothetical protein